MTLHSPAGEALLNAYFGQGGGQIVLDDVQCTSSENKLLVCSSAPILEISSNCDHSDDVGVRCEGTCYKANGMHINPYYNLLSQSVSRNHE